VVKRKRQSGLSSNDGILNDGTSRRRADRLLKDIF